jgi:hypothetical protein
MARLTPDVLRSLAIGPHQLICRDVVLAHGHSAHSWRTARANGFFDEVMPGIGIETGRSLDPKGLIAAAVAAASDGAMASHRSCTQSTLIRNFGLKSQINWNLKNHY